MNKDDISDFEVKDTNVDENETEISQLTEIENEVHELLNPTRYGDWEKNGRCIDF